MAVIPYILAVMLLLLLYGFIMFYLWARQPRSGTTEWIHMELPRRLRFFGGHYTMDRDDILPLAAIMILWALIAFWNLGDTKAPQSFHIFQDKEYYVEIDLGEVYDLGRVVYYTGLNTGSYSLSFSEDGELWTEQEAEADEDGEPQAAMPQGHASLFKWLDATLSDSTGVRYIRISATKGQPYLGELAIYTVYGQLLDAGEFTVKYSDQRTADSIPATDSELFDEQALIPEVISYLNSSYFDEIYHARTAYENVVGMYPYEISHPPLGKLIISIGIRLFGMTPFGWRFMGVLFGTVMLACFYALVKSMFGKRMVAICATLVFTFDFMHYVQTRISTIDTYAVFFIILMFFFMYRYISLDYETPFKKTLPPLFLSGLFFGIGAASKWTSIYFGIALALLYFIYQVLRGIHWVRLDRTREFRNYALKTVGVSIVFFILIPGIIYYLSYIPYGQAKDVSIFSREYLQIVIDNQKYMLTYHQGVTSEHPYSSKWYQWILDIRPILYYRSYLADGTKSAISAFGNPVVYWGGLLSMLTIAVPDVRKLRGLVLGILMLFLVALGIFVSSNTVMALCFLGVMILSAVGAAQKRDGRALAILIAYYSLLVPWLFISRPTFAYHYFTNTIFLVLAIAHIFDQLTERQRGRYKAVIITFTGVAIGLFIIFYPALSGMPIPTWYSSYILKWLPSWPV